MNKSEKIIVNVTVGIVGSIIALKAGCAMADLAYKVTRKISRKHFNKKYEKKIKKGLEDGSIIEIDGQYYEMKVKEA